MGSKTKSGKSKAKKNKTKTTDGSKIAAAIMPSAMLAAVPRTPPPPARPEALDVVDLKASSGILNSSLLGKMFTTQPDDGHVTEETDTSLHDYDHAKNPMSTYGSQEFSGLPKPPAGFADSDSETDVLPTPSDHMARSYEVEINPVYATHLKSSQRLSNSYSPLSSLRHSGTFTETGTLPHTITDTGTLPRNGTLRSSGGSLGTSGVLRDSGGSGERCRPPRRTPSSNSVEERIEAQLLSPQKSSLQSSLDRTLTKVSTDLSHTGSFRLNTLREQNAALVNKQSQLEQQLVSQRQLQEQLMTKLKDQGLLVTQSVDAGSLQEVGSLLQETQSVTDQTLDRQQDVMTTMKERISVIENQNRELEEMNEQLRMEIMSVHRIASAREDDESGSHPSRVKKLKDERDTLQAMTVKLSSELSRYQAKFRPLSQSELDNLPGLPATGPKPSWLISTKHLAPLFVAYDDQLKEKNDMVKQMQQELEEICHGVEEVIRENQRLHVRLEQSGGVGPVGMTEWRSLQEQCKLVLEENQLLMEQLDVQQSKVKDMHKAHIQEVSKLSKRLVISEAERNQLEQEVVDIRDRMTVIKKEHTSVLIENKSKLGVEEHSSALSQFKQTFEEERHKHAHDLENAMSKLQNVASDRKSLALQVEDLQTENQNRDVELKSLQKAFKKSQKRSKILQTALEESEIKEQTAERYLSSIIKVAEKTAHERDTFVEKAEVELRQKKAAMNKVLEGSFAKTKMEEKIKLVKSKASDKLEKAVVRMKEQDDDFNQQRQEYEREIKHLRLLLRERQEIIEDAFGEKRRVEDDLETMWQVATADNQRMRDTLHKSLRKLQDHGSLKLAMAEKDTTELWMCDSDAEQ